MASGRSLLVALCALHVLAAASAEDIVSLDTAPHSPANLGEGSALRARDAPVAADYISLRSDDWEDDEEEEGKYFVRRLGSNVVLTTLGGPIDRRNGAWVKKAPLCQPGFDNCPAQPEGTTECFSLEAADDNNLYLAKDRDKDEVKMRRFPFVDTVGATFCAHPGHSDPTHLSLESLAKPGFFMTHKDFRLALCNNKEDTPCGTSERFASQSTFNQMPARFFGSCHYNFKEGKKVGRPSCTCLEDFVGKNCDIGCEGGCGDHGSCTDAKGADEEAFCKCEMGHVGSKCELSCPVNPVTGTACGGRGECEFINNQPVCQCGEDYRGAACQFHCPGYDEDSGVCGGKGKCLLVDTPGPDEPPTRCECDQGFLGGSCGLRCPVDPVSNTVCSNRGECQLDTESGRTQCKCSTGFTGEFCEFTCPANLRGLTCNGQGHCAVQEGQSTGGAVCICKPGFSGPGCEAGCPGILAGVPCSGHGRCSFVGEAATSPAEEAPEEEPAEEDKPEEEEKTETKEEDGEKGKTVAVEGLDPAAGKATVETKLVDSKPEGEQAEEEKKEEPEEKKDDAEKDGVEEAVEQAIDAPKDEKADQKESDEKEAKVEQKDKEVEQTKPSRKLLATAFAPRKQAVCTCDEGFGGKGCGISCPRDENGSVCTGHGKCNMDGECVCAPGYVGAACQAGCPGTAEPAAVACNENGDCKYDPKTGRAQCACNEGFLGPSCRLMCPRGGATLDICSARGKCVVQRGVASCVCEEGFLGDNCGLACPGADAGSVCGDQGHCEIDKTGANTHCLCKSGFLGESCAIKCPGTGEDGRPCNGKGSCSLTESNAAVCDCSDGYLGADCGLKCPSDYYGNVCSGVGKCVEKEHEDGVLGTTCQCEQGYVNFNCDSSCPRNSADDSICSGHGSCEVTESTDISGQSRLRGSCQCDDGFLGDDCAHGCPTSKTNHMPCSGHGVCSFVGGNSACDCESGWVGAACSDRACVSQGSVFLGKIDKCQCETGYTCCSRENDEQAEERDATIQMMKQQKSLARSKLAMLERQLKQRVAMN